MVYREIMAVCYEIHTKHINTAVCQNVEFVNVKLGGTYNDQWDFVNQIHHHRSTDQHSEDTTVTQLSAGGPVGYMCLCLQLCQLTAAETSSAMSVISEGR